MSQCILTYKALRTRGLVQAGTQRMTVAIIITVLLLGSGSHLGSKQGVWPHLGLPGLGAVGEPPEA